MSKRKLRQHFLFLRNKISPEYLQETAVSAAAYLAVSDLFKQSEHIGCYLPFKNEFNSLPVIEAIWHANKNCYLPVLTEKNTLFFVRYRDSDALHPNRFGILEPKNITQQIAADQLDLVLTPLVAFDREGNRLGTGGGYYDRTFEFVIEKKPVKPHLIGLAFTFQEAERLPHDPWDICLEGVLTEKGVKNF